MNRTFVTALLVAVLAASASWALDFPGPQPGRAKAEIGNGLITLENDVISVSWTNDGTKVSLQVITDKMSATALEPGSMSEYWPIPIDLFQLILVDGKVIKSSDMRMEVSPKIVKLSAVRSSPNLASRSAGKAVAASFVTQDGNLQVAWRALLRDGSNYVRQELTLSAKDSEVPVREIISINFAASGGKPAGTVAGSPVVASNLFFAVEHPISTNTASNGVIRCAMTRKGSLKPGQPLTQTSVIGVVPSGQLRRGFLYYLERERAHPYRPFLHYNSWYDVPWGSPMTEKWMLDVIDGFGKELIKDRSVKLDSIVLDDGWDDMHTLWLVNKTNFPAGLKPLSDSAAKYGTHIGMWLSPWGGYGGAREERLKYGKAQGFETAGGFSLSGPNYYKRFSDVCLGMIKDYSVNYFKFDGTDAGRLEETEALLRLNSDLRSKSPDIFINMTTGTWPSPFWLMHGDSTWRGGGDTSQSGEGPARERWLNYRDSVTYANIVSQAPVYPLNSLMIHGCVYGHMGDEANAPITENALDHEIHSYFGSGTGLQELYISPDRMKAPEWDALAEAARWSRANSDVLVDTHWVGGDPAKGEVYGWAAWSKRKGILTLRCPSTKPGSTTIDIGKAFELPNGAPTTYVLKSPWKGDSGKAPITLTSGTPYTFALQPFDVLVLEALPVAEH